MTAKAFAGKFEKFTQTKLDTIMFSLIQRLQDYCGELPKIDYQSHTWRLSFRSPKNAEPIDLWFGGVFRGHCPMTIDRGGKEIQYAFRSETELDQIIPAERKEFSKRWETREIDFAKSLPRAIAPENGQREVLSH